eukprot:8537011-Pyramimonas_sp.AAC.1
MHCSIRYSASDAVENLTYCPVCLQVLASFRTLSGNLGNNAVVPFGCRFLQIRPSGAVMEGAIKCST